MRGRLVSPCLLASLLALAALAVPAPAVGADISEDRLNSLLPHAPIRITTNAEFTAANGVTGGNGTPDDPFVIGGWVINSSAANGVEIRNTDAHFILRDLDVHSADFTHSVFLQSLSNGRIENVTVHDGYDGLTVEHASDVALVSNTIIRVRSWGLWLLDTHRVLVGSNTVTLGPGLLISVSTGVDIVGNTFRDASHAVWVDTSQDLVFTRNELSNISMYGYYLYAFVNGSVDSNRMNSANVAIYFQDNNRNVTVRNNILTNNSEAILASSSEQIFIIENSVQFNGVGINLLYTSNSHVSGNHFIQNSVQSYDFGGSGNTWDDGYPSGGNYWSDYGGIDECSGAAQNACPDPDGIGDTPYAIDHDTADRYPLVPFELQSHAPIVIRGNGEFTAANGVTNGSGLPGDPYVIEDWEIDASSAMGIRIESTTADFIIRNVNIHGGGSDYAGISMDSVANATVRNATLSGNANGLVVWSSHDVLIEENHAKGNWLSGLALGTADAIVRGNDVTRNVYGIQASSATNLSIEGNRVANNSNGIYMFNSWGTTVHNNTLSGNDYGLYAYLSFDNTIEGNRFDENGLGLVLFQTHSLVIQRNMFLGDGIVDFGELPEHYNSHTISADNTVDGLPIDYRVGCADMVIDRAAVGQVILADCSRVTVANTTFPSGDIAIQIAYSEDVLVASNTVHTNDYWGIRLFEVRNATVVNNNASANSRPGISIERVRSATIAGNFLTGGGFQATRSMDVAFVANVMRASTGAYFDGPYVIPADPVNNTTASSHGNLTIAFNDIETGYAGFVVQGTQDVTVVSNRVEGVEGYGIVGDRLRNVFIAGNQLNNNNFSNVILSDTANATIYGNRIGNSSGAGVYLYRTTGVIVFGNQFLENQIQALDDRGTENQWDAGYPGGGNYWSNYSGPDLCSGPNQDMCPDPDGVGDIPFIIDSDSRDRYPFVSSTFNTPPTAGFSVTPQIGNASTLFVADAATAQDLQDPASVLEVRWDWESDGTWDTTWSVTKRAEHAYATPGTKTIRVEVRDSEGMTDTAERTVLVDFDPPSVEATPTGTAGDQGWFRSDVQVTLSASDDLSGVSSVSYRLDEGEWSSYGAVSIRVPGDGRHVVEFFATDAAGNRGATQSMAVDIDSEAPALSNAEPTGVITQSSVRIGWMATDLLSGILRYELSLDGGPFESVGTATDQTFNLPDGDHAIRVRAIDEAGNSAEVELRFRVDTNLFSLSGPLGSLPTIGVAIGVVVVAVLVFLRLRPRKPSRFEDLTPIPAKTPR